MSTLFEDVTRLGQVIMMPIDELVENPDNPRYITKEQFTKLRQSVRDFPQMLHIRPTVIDENNVILGGNMRTRACKAEGHTEIPCVVAFGLTEEQKKEFIIKDNLGYGAWDWEMLANGFDDVLLEDWGLSVPDMDDIEAESSNQKHEKATPIEDDGFEIPGTLPTTRIQPGDLLEIGNHRLFCGDATREIHVRTLMAAARPRIMVTDPPYGVEYDAAWRNERLGEGKRSTGKVENDHRVSWKEAYQHFQGHVAYIWHASLHSSEVFTEIQSVGFDVIAQIIWNKQHFAISRGDYHWKHEPCWYAVKKGAKHDWQGARDQSTVWDIPNALKSGEEKTGHSTQKPIECMARPIRNNTSAGDAVYDPFGGSGSTMVACQELGRVALVMEIKPEYCQLIVDRMRKRYPGLSVLLNGLPFDK